LLASIRKFGVLCPLAVAPEKDGHDVILNGNRRWRCARQLDLPTIPCMVATAADDRGYAAHRFMLNTMVKPWTQAERKKALKRLGLTPTEATVGARLPSVELSAYVWSRIQVR